MWDEQGNVKTWARKMDAPLWRDSGLLLTDTAIGIRIYQMFCTKTSRLSYPMAINLHTEQRLEEDYRKNRDGTSTQAHDMNVFPRKRL